MKPAAGDRKNVHLLLIDVQKDFCFPEGTLYVAGRSGTGAMDDNKRLSGIVTEADVAIHAPGSKTGELIEAIAAKPPQHF